MKYSGKKILILGGKPIGSVDIVRYAKENGAYTIVTDNLPVDESPAKQLADKAWDISTAEVEILCNKIKENNVDAVFTGVHEFNIWRTFEVCNVLNIPFYATEEQLIKTSVKTEYKQLFRAFDIPVIDEFVLNAESFEKDIRKVDYPVLIKPVDGSGGYGISICYDEKELREGYEKALDYSKSKRVLVEKYINAKEVSIFYMIQNGKIMLSAMADRHTENGNKYTIPLPVLYTFPSVHLVDYQNQLNEKVIKAFKSIGLKDGMLFIQAFVDGDKFRFYDIGYRLTGTQEYHILENLCGYNPLKMLVDYAFTGNLGNEDLSNLVNPSFNGKQACNITFLVEPCLIGNFIGIEETENLPDVLRVIKNHQVGAEIPQNAVGTLNQVALRVMVVAENKLALKKLITEIIHKIDVQSTEGKSVILPTFKIDEL